MITVNCSQCKATLEMDDAFAGGVCRCHYCGTIQSVPANARRKSAAPVAPAGAHPRGGAAGAGNGLDALADVLASSGLSHKAANTAPVTAARTGHAVDYARPPQQKKTSLPLVIALVVIALLLGLVGFLIISGSTTQVVVGPVVPTPKNPGGTADGGRPAPESGGDTGPDTGGDTGGGSGGGAAIPQAPHFCGISLAGIPSVVYVLDSGQSTADLFDTLRVATYRSLESLKPGQKFQIVFWDNGEGVVSYPPEGLADVSPQQIEAARKVVGDVVAGGSAKADSAIDHAAASRPGAMVLVTAKAFALDPAFVDTVQELVKGSKTKVHTVDLRGDDGSTVLQDIAKTTGGEYRAVTRGELSAYSR